MGLPAPEKRSWERVLSLAGLVAVVLIIVQVMLHYQAPQPTESAARLFRFLDEWNGRVRWHSFFGALGAMALIAWMGAVSQFMRRAGGGGPVLAVSAGLGLTFGYVMINIPGVTLSAMAIIGTSRLDPSMALFVYTVVWNLGQVGDLGVALFVAAFSAVVVQRGVLPKALGWLGLLVAAFLLVSSVGVATINGCVFVVTSIAYVGFLAWTAVASALMFRSLPVESPLME